MDTARGLVSLLIMAIMIAIAFGAVIALPFMWLWNGCLVGAISGVSEIGYLQAWGLYILIAITRSSVSKK